MSFYYFRRQRGGKASNSFIDEKRVSLTMPNRLIWKTRVWGKPSAPVWGDGGGLASCHMHPVQRVPQSCWPGPGADSGHCGAARRRGGPVPTPAPFGAAVPARDLRSRCATPSPGPRVGEPTHRNRLLTGTPPTNFGPSTVRLYQEGTNNSKKK